jgi:hypothetical protein
VTVSEFPNSPVKTNKMVMIAVKIIHPNIPPYLICHTHQAPFHWALRHFLQSRTSKMDMPRRPDAIEPSQKKNLDLLGRQSSTSRVPTNELGPSSLKRNLWVMTCQVGLSNGARMRLIAINGVLFAFLKSRVQGTPTSSRQEVYDPTEVMQQRPCKFAKSSQATYHQ